MNEVLDAIRDRRSIRSYTDAPVTDEQIKTLMDVCVQSPSAMNRQPYHFSFVKDADVLNEFSSDVRKMLSTREGAPERFKDPAFDVRYGAPLVIFIFAENDGIFTKIDCGIAAENLALAAHSMNLGTVILGMPRDLFEGPDGEKWYKKLCPTENAKFAIAVAVGTPAATKDAHPVREKLITVI